ncbi:MAG: VOC family protein [Gemmatimonadota bacterium]|nr:VOC family protein [Gemmatimonadota bacterium]
MKDPREGTRATHERKISRILETPLYVADIERAARFYEDVLGLRRMSTGNRLIPMDAGGGTVLLIFLRGATTEGSTFPGGWIPPHDGKGRSHFAFAIDPDDVEGWREQLGRSGIEIESEVRWPRGGTSLYIRDPDGHSVELATPGVWPVY